MRIAIVAEAFEGGGAERQAAIWAKLLADLGHEVTAGSILSGGGVPAHDRIRRVKIPKAGARDFVAIARLLRSLQSEVDAVIAFQPYLGLCCAAARLRIPWMIVTGKVPAALREGSRIPTPVYRWAFDRAWVAAAPCAGMVTSHQQLDIRPHQPWMVIPNVADDAAFATGEEPREGALFVGRLTPVKDPQLAIESAVAADVPLTMLGDGAMRGELEAQLSRLPAARVTMMHYNHEPWPVYRRHRVLLVTSQLESFGNVIVEALAAGTPVVSVDCDFGPREIIAGATYSTLTSRSPVEIAAELSRVVDRPYGEEERAECLEIADRYRLSAIAPLIEEALSRLRPY